MEKHILFYDGHCALCHNFVTFVLKRDKGEKFIFSPLQGQTIKKVLAEDIRLGLPDSVVVLSNKNELYLKGRAVVFVLSELEGIYNYCSSIISYLPKRFVDRLYDLIAAYRTKFFGMKSEVCPVLPADKKPRFLN